MEAKAQRLVPMLMVTAVVLGLAVPALADFTTGADTHCPTSIGPTSIVAADFTGNGVPGAATVADTEIAGTDVSVWTNDGSWDATQCPDTGEDTYSLGSNPDPKGGIGAGDFDNNDEDIVAVGINGDTGNHVIWVFENDGSGSFSSVDEYTLSSGEVPTEVATADFNADGFDDVVTANNQSDSASVFMNKGLLGSQGDRFESPDHYSLKGGARDPVQLVTADMDGQDNADVVIANSGSDNLSVLLNDGSGSFTDDGTTSVGNTPLGVTTGDFNNDGSPDVASANSGDNRVEVLENKGTSGGTWDGLTEDVAFLVTNSGPESVTADDLLDSNGVTDLAAISGQHIAVFENDKFSDATTWVKDGEYDVEAWKPRQVITGDLDGDGEPDLLTPADSDDSVSVLFN